MLDYPNYTCPIAFDNSESFKILTVVRQLWDILYLYRYLNTKGTVKISLNMMYFSVVMVEDM